MKLSARTRSLVAAGLILGVGFAGGSVFGMWLSLKFITQFVAVSVDAPGPGDYLAEKLLRDLTRQLELTEAERADVGAEMRATVVQTKRLRAETTMKLRTVLADATERMAAKMAPDKAKEFRELTARRLRMIGLDELNEPQWQERKAGK